MTPAEGIISVVGLIAGYWVVSNFLNPSGPPGDKTGESDVPPESPLAEEIGHPYQVTVDNWHEVLEVSPDASQADISSAYRRRISQYHPDKVAHMGAEIRALADTRSQEINAAYNIGIRLRGSG